MKPRSVLNLLGLVGKLKKYLYMISKMKIH